MMRGLKAEQHKGNKAGKIHDYQIPTDKKAQFYNSRTDIRFKFWTSQISLQLKAE